MAWNANYYKDLVNSYEQSVKNSIGQYGLPLKPEVKKIFKHRIEVLKKVIKMLEDLK